MHQYYHTDMDTEQARFEMDADDYEALAEYRERGR